MQLDQDTIVAVATPPGRGGIGIVRLSGAQARAIAAPLCRLRNPLLAGRARFAEILDDDGAVLDEAVVTYFAAPHSYTSEDVVEIAAHGAPVLLEYLVRACLRGGARLAEPGEFTARAFLSGRLDLTQAEAVNDLIAAQTLTQARMAAAQLGGSVAQKVAPMKQKLIRLIAELEAGVDFAEDDLDLMPQAAIVAQTMAILAEVENFAATYSHARIVREGVTLAIVGRPNAGKSSLFNRLLGLERAIVTAQPGTTRDAIAEQLAIGGIPVELIDTAGLRDAPEGEAEALGIARTRTALAEAYLVLYVIDATSLPARDAEDTAIEDTLAGCNHLVLYNKCDLVKTRTESQGLYLSTRTGEGIDALQQAMLAAMTRMAPTTDTALVTNLRQHQTLTEAVEALRRGQWGAAAGVPHEVLLLDLHAALEALDALTGATSSDDILRLIFSTFCIGK